MTGFYGRTYRYKDKEIGVCNTLNPGTYMVGYATTGGHKRMKSIPICGSVEEAQKALGEFAQSRGLSEVGA